jgi:hypothetical protein
MAMDPNTMGGDPNMMGGDPNTMGGDPNMMGGDPNMMGGDPNMEMDPNAMGGDQGAMENDPNALGGEEENPRLTNLMNTASNLSDDDLKATESYADSLLSKDETQTDDNGQQEGGAPMMEQVIFKKSQVKKLQENFGPSQDELMKKNDKKELPKKQSSKIKNSPFSPPKFQ